MSTLKAQNLQNPSAGSPAIVLASDGTATAQLSSVNGGPLAGARNRIINGDMRIDQRNAGASVTPTATAYIVDRFSTATNVSSKFSAQQNAGSITPPTGFTKYLGITSLSAYTLAAGEYASISQPIEGFNVADFAWGSASAVSVTLSFWVRSSLTGTFGGAIQNVNTRSYPFTYSISTANTWEYKTITIAGDTSGTWATDNTQGMVLRISLGAGSTYSGTSGAWAGANYLSATGAVSVLGTNGATFYITGVQLEAGSVSTPFERRLNEVSLCQRYFVGTNEYYFTAGYDSGYTTLNSGGVTWPYTMRTTPTVVISGGSMSGHHTIAPTVRTGPAYQGAAFQFTGSALRTNANCPATVIMTLNAEL
jgi:hypothetical protein